MSDERGVSDVIGFVIVAGLLLASVALVSATAFTQLNEARDAQQRENVVRAFSVLDSNIDSVVTQSGTRRTTEVKLGDGQLGFGPQRTVNVTYESGGTIVSSNHTYTPLIYVTPNGDRVVYSNGAVIRDLTTGSSMAEDPSWYSTTQSKTIAYVSVIGTEPDFLDQTPLSVGGGTRAISVTRAESTISKTINNPKELNIKTPANHGAWLRYCQDKDMFSSASVSGDVVTCTFDNSGSDKIDRLYFDSTRVRVFLS